MPGFVMMVAAIAGGTISRGHMMSVAMPWLIWGLRYAGNLVLQVTILLFLAPWCCWVMKNVPRMVCGLSVAPLNVSYCRFLGFFRQRVLRRNLQQHEALCLAVLLVVFVITPGFVPFSNGGADEVMPPLADIMLIGGLLLVAGGCLHVLPQSLTLTGLVMTLCLAEGLLSVAAPGQSNLLAGQVTAHMISQSGVMGVSVCCAVALILLSPLGQQAVNREDTPGGGNALFMMLQMGWLLVLGDLLLPGFVGGAGILGLVGLCFRLGAVLVMVMLFWFMDVRRCPEMISLAVGLGILLALAGRFAP